MVALPSLPSSVTWLPLLATDFPPLLPQDMTYPRWRLVLLLCPSSLLRPSSEPSSLLPSSRVDSPQERMISRLLNSRHLDGTKRPSTRSSQSSLTTVSVLSVCLSLLNLFSNNNVVLHESSIDNAQAVLLKWASLPWWWDKVFWNFNVVCILTSDSVLCILFRVTRSWTTTHTSSTPYLDPLLPSTRVEGIDMKLFLNNF